jgi:DNA repair photolyase
MNGNACEGSPMRTQRDKSDKPDEQSDVGVSEDTAEIEINEQRVLKGRGATLNPASRYLPTSVRRIDDGWHVDDSPDPDPVTQFYADRTVRIITRNKSPDVPFDRSINAYKGCEHGCVYCFARPTHAYLDLSPGLDFETRIFHKTDVQARLSEELSARGYQARPIAMGTNTDPYQPGEKSLRITREILEVACETRHPVTIVTKSQLILRDVDLLSDLATDNLVSVAISVTTLDNALKVKLEPRTASPAARLRTLEKLNAYGIPTGAMVAPVIPFINDHELESIVAACSSAGAASVNYILIRLPLEVSELFEDWLGAHYPLKADKVMNTIRNMRGGKTYDSTWGKRMRGEGAFADLLESRFTKAIKRHGVPQRGDLNLNTELFMPPNGGQMDLF